MEINENTSPITHRLKFSYFDTIKQTENIVFEFVTTNLDENYVMDLVKRYIEHTKSLG